MNEQELVILRKQAVSKLAMEIGYVATDTGTTVDLMLENTKIFAYDAQNNALFTYKTKYSKYLQENGYLNYIRTCLVRNLPVSKTTKTYGFTRYVVESRGVGFAVYDNLGGRKIDSYISHSKAKNAADMLNSQWLSIK